MKGLNELSKSVFEANKKKGFWDDRKNKGEVLMLVVSELAEALEADRKSRYADVDAFNAREEEWETDEDFQIDFQQCIKDTFEDEIADTMIRLLDLCGGFDIDIAFHVEQKLRYNSLREHKHGKKY